MHSGIPSLSTRNNGRLVCRAIVQAADAAGDILLAMVPRDSVHLAPADATVLKLHKKCFNISSER